MLVPPLVAFVLALALWCGIRTPAALHAAQPHQELQSYTVVAGDTLAAIAERYGVSLEALVQLNSVADPSLINVGQELLIPAPGSEASVDALSAVPTVRVRAKPGETLLGLSRRLAQDAAVLSTLNSMSETARLFPGQSVQIPADGASESAFNPLRFGSVTSVSLPDVLVQGRTGHLVIETARPLSLTATWNGLPLGFTDAGADAGDGGESANHRVHALLPVPALLAPTLYPVVITYTASNGTLLDRTWFVNVVEGAYDTQDIVLPPDKGVLLDPEISQAEEELVYNVWSQFTPELYWTGVFSRPIGVEYPTTSPYGTRRSYNSGPVASYHAGQDFGAPEGVLVLAPADGVVALAEPLDIRGNAVILDHGGGIFTGYWHLIELRVEPGQAVQTGDVLGLVGTTGLSTGAHLHWELRIYTIAVDPLQFLDEPLLLAP